MRSVPYPVEMGMAITMKSGKKIRLMSNNLEADEIFMDRLQNLYLKYDDTFSQYLKDENYPKGDKMLDENLQKLQKRMEES